MLFVIGNDLLYWRCNAPVVFLCNGSAKILDMIWYAMIW